MKLVMKNVVALILVCMMCSGCVYLIGASVGARVVAGAYEYVQGEVKRPYVASMHTTWMACQDALEDVGVELSESSTEEPTHWTMKAMTKNGKKIKIALDTISKDITKVSVRVGIFGDETLSEMIHDAIARQLEEKGVPG